MQNSKSLFWIVGVQLAGAAVNVVVFVMVLVDVVGFGDAVRIQEQALLNRDGG